jgi:peptide/nickel transport system ATP-binding protein/oligopeptide transport system ATP-binding protein
MKTAPLAHAPLLELDDVIIGFADMRGIVLAADRISFRLEANQTLGLLGESGCGKSVTLRALLGLIPYPGEVVAGRILWDGQDLRALPARDWGRIRGTEISMIFQDPTACLNPVFTVGNQIVETLTIKAGLSKADAQQRAVELLDRVGIPSPKERLKLYPHQLSGGMRQRIMIAIAIATQPRLLLADEPTTALDVTIQDQILMLLAELKQERQMSMILVSHDVGVIAQQSDLIAVMYAGKILECGRAVDVIERPRHPYTRGLLAAVPTLDAPGQRQPLQSIPGQPPSLADLPPGCPFQARCAFVRPECAAIPVTLDRVMPEHGSACPFVGGGAA